MYKYRYIMDSSTPVQAAPSPPQQQQQEQLSGVAVVIIITVGLQTFIMLFIFAKRQIRRFTLRSRRGPHVSVGQGALKVLRKEIDRRIEYAAHVRYEPVLASSGGSGPATAEPPGSSSDLRYRVMAVDKLVELDTLVADYDSEYFRPAWTNVRSFLLECLAGPLVGLEPKKIHRFCDLYEQARHSHRPFRGPELAKYLQHLSELKLQVIHNIRNKPALYKKASGGGGGGGGVQPAVSASSVHRRFVNRPQRRTFSAKAETKNCSAHRNSSSLLIAVDPTASGDSTPV